MSEIVYINRDNDFSFDVYKNGTEAIDGTAITKTALILKSYDESYSLTIDSDSNPTMFSWSNNTVTISVGTHPSLVKGEYVGRLVLYDSNNTNGIVWGDPFVVVVDNE